MRQIDVDLDVYAAIWASRRPGEISENEVLRRLLLVENLRPNATHRDGGVEQKTSNPKPDVEEAEMGKIRWVDDVRMALKALGGQAHLSRIYEVVRMRRREGGRSVPKTLEATIRRTLEDHSSDSANFKGEDLFALIGRGIWALR